MTISKTLAPIAVTAALFASSAQAQQYTINDIRFVGLRSTAPGTIINYLPITTGQRFGNEAIPGIASALRSSGLFESVEVTPTGNALVITVTEAGTIGQINITGEKSLKEKEIIGLLKDSGIHAGARFSPAAISQAKALLKEAYRARGKYNVRTQITTSPLAGNRSALNIRIQEGVTGKIRVIQFTGNEKYSDGRLRAQMQLRPAGATTWLSKRDIYSPEKLEADLETIKRFYQNRGFIEAQARVNQLKMSSDQSDMGIDILINEGQQFRINSIGFAGRYPLKESSLMALVDIPRGAIYDRREVEKLTEAVADKLGDYGYAQAVIDVQPRLNRSNNSVDLIYNINAGNRVYVRRINFAGNTTTEDKVLRDRMRQAEGSWFSTREIKQSQRNLGQLGYFDNIAFEPVPVSGTPDQVDLNVQVDEALTSSIRGGLGYGQDAGVMFNFQLDQRNFQGSGRDIQLGLTYSKAEKGLNFSLTNPYFTKNGVSQTFGASYKQTDPSQINRARYLADEATANVRFGFPLNENDTLFLGAGVEYYDFTTGANTPAAITSFVNAAGGDVLNYKVTASYAKDTRDKALFPTSGTYSRIGFEASTPGSDDEYIKTYANSSAYFGLGEFAVIKASGSIGYGFGYGDSNVLPFYKNYFTGGTGSVRGFKNNSLGERYSDTNSVKGGAFETTATLGLVTPFILAPNNESLKTELFVDAGNVFASPKAFDADEIRYSAGLALQYYSPFGVIALSYAQPLNDKPGDEVQKFQFSIGVSY